MPGKLLWGLLLWGCCLRLLACWSQPQLLSDDADGYVAHAQSLLQTGRFSGPWTGRPTAFRPPLLPLFLSFPMAFGMSPAAAVLLTQLLASLLCVLAGVRLAGRMNFGLRGSVLIGLAVAMDPLLLRYSMQPMTETVCAGLLTYGLLLLADNERAAVQWRSGLLAGLVFGAGVLLRPVMLIAAVLILLLETAGRLRSTNRAMAAVQLPPAVPVSRSPWTWFLAGLLLVVTPWILRNRIVLGSWVVATTHGGYTLALGNNPDFYRDVIRSGRGMPWDGQALDSWQQRSLEQAAAAGIDVGDEVSLDDWYYGQAVEAIRSDPGSFCAACLLRMQRFWALSSATSGGWSAIIPGTWYLVLWAGLLLQLSSGRWREQIPRWCWLCVVAFCLLHLVYWTDTRMRAPLTPLLILLSADGYRWCRGWFRSAAVTDRQSEPLDPDAPRPVRQESVPSLPLRQQPDDLPTDRNM